MSNNNKRAEQFSIGMIDLGSLPPSLDKIIIKLTEDSSKKEILFHLERDAENKWKVIKVEER